ncbi:MAG: 2-oxoacid:acceptor oxidoreductase family protein [Planctomycetes bacterium]|nr:2-oxoacid:acceptor oxidoreductase family protein [Planctomycetota bacterium]
MLRVRFHGRGGHGVKTASRILGSAAFCTGLQVQDSPVYGAERRGAAIAAFTRIDKQVIQERGLVLDPDLILVADETLFTDPGAALLAGVEFASVVFINSARDRVLLATEYGIPCPVVTLDLSTLTTDVVGRGASFSATLGTAACALAGITDRSVVSQAVQKELESLHLTPELIAKNVNAASQVLDHLSAVSIRERPQGHTASPIHPPIHLLGPEGTPVIYAPGNSARRHTGSWRVFRPEIDLNACTRCGICFAECPDAAIHLNEKAFPVVDYDNCKGCLICETECPVHCISEQKEVRT